MGNIRRLGVLLLIAVSGCGQSNEAADSAAAPEVVRVASPEAEAGEKVAADVAQTRDARPAVALPQIAYSYDFTLELPAAAVVPVFQRHRQACEAAGPARCQVVGAETESVGGTDTQATLTIRAETGWLTAFRARLDGEASRADGRIAASKTESEDLGRDLSDTAARLRALTTLQTRLEGLLATRTGKLVDLLEIERELARVGGEIDATRSALADMRGRVALPKATLTYQPDSLSIAGAGGGGGIAGQLYDAARGSLFAMLQILAALLPWLLVLVPVGWLLLRLRRRRARP